MKKIYSVILVFVSFSVSAQNGAPENSYYTSFNWSLTGTALQTSLSNLTITKHTNYLSYTPGVWEASRITDLDPANNNNVLLVYGFENGTDNIVTNDRSRSKTANGGNTGNWNREHVYPQSLGTPALSTSNPSDAGEDAHHLRPSDVQWNAERGNLKFAVGSGNSGKVSGGWYPGDEWKGDVARMMMYMYLRYPTQCLPVNVGTGTTANTDANMPNLFLQWNVEDPVSAFEDGRNTYHGSNGTFAQGNRNPFIDNPYLATLIWGGTAAENRWPNVFLSIDNYDLFSSTKIYPNPSSNNKINISTSLNLNEIQIININGQVMQLIQKPTFTDNNFSIENLPSGFYFVKLHAENKSITKKVIIN